MNIGLLVTELEDAQVKDLCTGAALAAKEKDIKLIIIPGRYIEGDNKEKDPLYSYQNSALFDYGMLSGIDAVIVDVDRIGSRTTILKREALLKKFEGIPVITLGKHEDYLHVSIPESADMSVMQVGFKAVCDAYSYVKSGKISALEQPGKLLEEESNQQAMTVIGSISERIFKRNFEPDGSFKELSLILHDNGISDLGIFAFEKRVRNTVKYPWTLPDKVKPLQIFINGKDYPDYSFGSTIETKEILKVLEKSRSNAFILGDLFTDEYQLGVFFAEFAPLVKTDSFFSALTGIITGIARISFLEKEFAITSKELLEVQEELARDDSVLDHIGDQDYLTGGLNRRGFFAKAYDLLKERFTPGRYAIVAYIHMESLKRINEIFGHEEGDRAVKKVAEILDEVFGNCVYGRIRGDEFAVITIADDDAVAESFREEMADQNNRLLALSGRYINRLQYSICEFGYEEDYSLRQMLKETDENLQRLKGNG